MAGAKRDLSMEDIKKFSPAFVGFLRGLVLAIIVGLIGGLTTIVQSGQMGKAGLVLVGTTVTTAVLRFIEGILDGKAGAQPSPTPLGFAKKTK